MAQVRSLTGVEMRDVKEPAAQGAETGKHVVRPASFWYSVWPLQARHSRFADADGGKAYKCENG